MAKSSTFSGQTSTINVAHVDYFTAIGPVKKNVPISLTGLKYSNSFLVVPSG